MALRIGDKAPDFEADTTKGRIKFHEWIGDNYAILFSHPKDFTPVCTTELGYLAKLQPEFAKRGVKIIGLSVDPVTDHHRWRSDIHDVTVINGQLYGVDAGEHPGWPIEKKYERPGFPHLNSPSGGYVFKIDLV